MGPRLDAGGETIAPQSIAVVTGSFLAGAMACLSVITIPVFLDTNTDPNPTLLLRQWVRTYEYGFSYMPPVCIVTCGLYGYAALSKHRNGKHWLRYMLASVMTSVMVPFTWIFMAPTNKILYEWNVSSARTTSAVDLSAVSDVVIKWAWLHVARSVFPMIGVILGFRGLLEELGGS